jgi:glutamine synthetase
MGCICRLGYEFEFYVLNRETRKPVYGGQPIFVTLKNNFDINFTYDLMRKMDQAGVRIITQNSEHGPGQQEINLYYKDGLAAADTAFLYKMGTKEMALQYGYILGCRGHGIPLQDGHQGNGSTVRLYRHLDDKAVHRCERIRRSFPREPH